MYGYGETQHGPCLLSSHFVSDLNRALGLHLITKLICATFHMSQKLHQKGAWHGEVCKQTDKSKSELKRKCSLSAHISICSTSIFQVRVITMEVAFKFSLSLFLFSLNIRSVTKSWIAPSFPLSKPTALTLVLTFYLCCHHCNSSSILSALTSPLLSSPCPLHHRHIEHLLVLLSLCHSLP